LSKFLANNLLKQKNEEILLYEAKYKLNWVKDINNQEINFDQNFIGYWLLSMTKEKWLNIITKLNQVSQHCFEMNELFQILYELDL
jgi:tRNA(Ile)-lysidine synthase TilS/MesJ